MKIYAGPAINPTARKTKTKRSGAFLTIAASSCGIILLGLIATTIVLALIPVYLPKKSVTVNPNAATSNEVIMYVEVEKNHTVELESKRKKRAEGDLSGIVGCTFGTAGLQMVQNTLVSILPKKAVKDVVVTSVAITYSASKRKKRFALSKRQTNANQKVILVIKFYIVFISDCLFQCQSYNSPIIQQALSTAPNYNIVYNNVPIYKNGVFFINAPQIEFIAVTYISSISPGVKSSDQAATAPPTVYLISNTTTAMTTITTTTILINPAVTANLPG